MLVGVPLALGFSAGAPASAAPSALCREAHLANFWVEGSRDEFNKKDLCAVDPALLPAKFQEAIRDAQEVHEKVAATFRLAPELLFPKGVDLKIIAGKDGTNGTYKDESKQVELGNVPSPARWVNRAVYAHELGHWVADSKNPLVPAYFRDSRLTFLLDETMADTVALAAYGAFSDLEPDLPACMVPRVIGSEQSYVKQPIDFFAARNGLRSLLKCCQESAGSLSSNASAICEGVATEAIKRKLPKLRPGVAFSPQAVLANLSLIDNHQIGVPLNSFFFSLGEKLGYPVYQDFLNVAASAKGTPLRCAIDGDGPRAERVAIKVVPLVDQLRAFRASLSAQAAKTFDERWQAHGLDAALALNENELGDLAAMVGQEAIFQAMVENRSAKLNQKHRCYLEYVALLNGKKESVSSRCELSCQP